jgi:DNA-binding transcriptional regulator YiaG
MEVKMIPAEQFENYIEQMKKMEKLMQKLSQETGKKVLTNPEFMKYMDVSARTLQNWRDEGRISFSQIGSKIYYTMDDIFEFLGKYRKEQFHKKH